MNKDVKTVVTEYGNSLSDEELRWLVGRLTDRLSGDLSDAINVLSKNRRIDSILSSVDGAEGLFDMLDQIRDTLHQICKKKGLIKAA
tara:strand:- start:723 stop:983 length:261 start_codon:yes stop_codon:yes gene_type:complete